jgi:hypothetical protein
MAEREREREREREKKKKKVLECVDVADRNNKYFCFLLRYSICVYMYDISYIS